MRLFGFVSTSFLSGSSGGCPRLLLLGLFVCLLVRGPACLPGSFELLPHLRGFRSSCRFCRGLCRLLLSCCCCLGSRRLAAVCLLLFLCCPCSNFLLLRPLSGRFVCTVLEQPLQVHASLNAKKFLTAKCNVTSNDSNGHTTTCLSSSCPGQKTRSEAGQSLIKYSQAFPRVPRFLMGSCNKSNMQIIHTCFERWTGFLCGSLPTPKAGVAGWQGTRSARKESDNAFMCQIWQKSAPDGLRIPEQAKMMRSRFLNEYAEHVPCQQLRCQALQVLTWEYKTQHTHCSWTEQRKQQQYLQNLISGQQQDQHKKQSPGYNCQQTSSYLKHILISMKSGFAATAVRQHQQEIALEVYKQLCVRFSTPLGTRSIGYLTKLLKPTFDHNNFEEAFSNWEFELQRYEAANATRLPDPVKIAALMNETKGPLQPHLHLNAGGSPAYT